jgi:hypothetical protein
MIRSAARWCIMHQEILALIENILGNLIGKKLKGVLSLRLMDHKFGCRDVRSRFGEVAP